MKSSAARFEAAPSIGQTIGTMFGLSFPRFRWKDVSALIPKVDWTVPSVTGAIVAEVAMTPTPRGTNERIVSRDVNCFRNSPPHCLMQWASSTTINRMLRLQEGSLRSAANPLLPRHISGDVRIIRYSLFLTSCRPNEQV